MEGVRFGDFEVIKKIGEGGMGQVYLARQISLDREVALKVLPERLAKDDSFRTRFEREARSAAKLNHPNIISIFAFGIKDGIPYFAMEYVDGRDLATILRESGPLPVKEALRIAKEVARALDAAHRQGVIHRDIKPSNIMVRKDGVVKVTDFGLAKVLGSQSLVVTQANVVLGTPHYMSPEQGKGGKLDPRSDIYSLGVVLYEMLAGDVPFKADTATSLIYQHIYEKPPPLSEKAPYVPPVVAAVVMRMLEKDPDKRFQKASELAEAIEQVERGVDASGVSGLTLELGVLTPQDMKKETEQRKTAEQRITEASGPAPHTEQKEQARPTTQVVGVTPWLAFVIALAIIGGIGLAAFFSFRVTQKQRKPPPQTKQPTGKQPVVAKPPKPKPKRKVLFPALAIIARFPQGSRLFVRKADHPPPGVELRSNTALEVGTYKVRVEKKGYEPVEFEVLLDEGGLTPQPDSIKIELKLRRDLQERLEKAEEWEGKKEFALALKAIRKVLQDAPDYGGAEIRKRIADLETLLKHQKEADKRIDVASSIVAKSGSTVEELESAVKTLEEIAQRYKDVVKDFEKRVPPLLVTAREQLSKRKQFLNTLSKARRLIAEGQLSKARVEVNAARDLFPGDMRIRELEETIVDLEKIEQDAKDAMNQKDWEKAVRLMRLFLKGAPQCRRIATRLKEAEGNLKERERLKKRLDDLIKEATLMVRNAPDKVPKLTEQAAKVIERLKERHGLTLDREKNILVSLKIDAKREWTKKRVCAFIGLLDSLFLKRDREGILRLIEPKQKKLRLLFERQLVSFFSSRLRIIESRHIVKKVRLSEDLKKAEVEAEYIFEFEHSVVARRLKGVRKKRFVLVERSGKWFIQEVR